MTAAKKNKINWVLFSLVGLLFWLPCWSVFAQDSDISMSAKSDAERPPLFRTDLAIQLTIGVNHCVGGGTEYAECDDVDWAWDPGFGLAGGLLVRPFKMFSLGLEASYGGMRHHQRTDNRWRDVQVGPTARLHIPIPVNRFLLEPSLGFGAGWVKGTFKDIKDEDNNTTNYKHAHNGGFLAFMLGLDFFPIPKWGIGLEMRLNKPLYGEVCFESAEQTICRGSQDEDVTDISELLHGNIPKEKMLAKYPWKLIWGLHSIYYF